MSRMKKLLIGLLTLAILFLVFKTARQCRPIMLFNLQNYAKLRINGFRSHSVQVNGCRIHYYVGGHKGGQPIVLIHGLGSRAEDWRELAPLYAQWLFRVYLIDLPGYGASDQPADFSYSMSDQAEMVNGFMQAVGLQQADVGGWSMGGWIAQKLALRHPERVRRLTLFSSAGLSGAMDWDPQLFTPTTPAQLDRLESLLSPTPPVFPENVSSDLLRLSRQNAWVVRRSMEAMLSGREATDAELSSLNLPVLLLWGEADRITPLEEGRRFSELIPQAQFMTFTGCGHLAPLECADRVGQVAIEFGRN